MNDAILPSGTGSLEPEPVMVGTCVAFGLPAIMKMKSVAYMPSKKEEKGRTCKPY